MARMTFQSLALVLGISFLSGCGLSGQATPWGTGSGASVEAQRRVASRFKVTKAVEAKNWDQIECLRSTVESFPEERARPNGRQVDSEVVKAFGTPTPPSEDVLLHYADGWNKGQGTPVLLVHGSLLEANSAWVHPHGKAGLAKTLAQAGFRVFAVTFAHRHGDNMLQAEQIANAIARIKEVTNSRQVDVIAHSKGTVATRALVSGVKLGWMAPFRKDIRTLVHLGGPHLGLDYSFRHPAVNLGLFPEKDDPLRNAPLSWTGMLAYGKWTDTRALSFMRDKGDYFPGQSQMLYRWDKVYPLPPLEQDWYTTYHGGRGFISESPGIDAAIKAGGNFIERLRKRPVDPSVKLAVLAGDRADMANILNENTGPSDGLVFVKSATETGDMTKGGAKLVAKEILHLNHMELIYAPEAKRWILNLLEHP